MQVLDPTANNQSNTEIIAEIQAFLATGADYFDLYFKNLHGYECNFIQYLLMLPNFDRSVLQFMLANKLDLQQTDEYGCSVLSHACRHLRNPELIKLLLDNGADIHTTSKNGLNAIRHAYAWNENLQILQLLLQYGATLPDNKFQVLTDVAVFNPNPDILQFLINNGFDINLRYKNGSDVLHMSCALSGNLSVIEFLLDQGLDPNRQNADGYSPFHRACVSNLNVDVVKFLINKGCSIYQTNYRFESIFMNVCRIGKNSNTLRLLLEKGVDTQQSDRFNANVLMIACANNPNLNIIKVLIEYGFSLKTKDNEGKTAIDHAKANKNPEILEYLQTLSDKQSIRPKALKKIRQQVLTKILN